MTVQLATDVAAALTAGEPLVALESTIITHGMPYPQNVETAIDVEDEVRRQGAVPATIAVLGGILRIGLSKDELHQLATATDVLKLSRADLALAISRGVNGSTTVAATMIAADLAGIRFFATGGIGGVHRNVQETFDISADLTELTRTPVTVICAGAKAILDIPRTMEYLETLGVPVIAYRSDEVPAFWSRRSGVTAPIRCDHVTDVCRFIQARRRLALQGGVLVTNPVPIESEIPLDQIEAWIELALNDATERRLQGKQITPFVLSRMVELSHGRSLTTNVALIRNNARLAAELAICEVNNTNGH